MVNNQTVVDRVESQVVESEIVPVSRGEGTGHITHMGDDMLALITKAAKNAQAIEEAYTKIIVACTFNSDWTKFGDKAELGSAGSERLLKHFPIKITNMTRQRREWADKHGPAYSWTYETTAVLQSPSATGGSEVQVSATYGTRDKFKCFVNGEWRDMADINEGDLMAAARHKCISQAIKTLLGLRNMPKERIEKYLGELKSSEDGRTGSATFAQGSQGGISDDDRKHQDELWNMLLEMYNQNEGEATAALKTYTEFQGEKGPVSQANYRKLKGAWLGKTLGKVRTVYAQWQKNQDDSGPGSEG